MRSLKNQSGSVIVFITLVVVLLLVMVGMGLDTGWVVYSRSMGQRAVDMAALAGAAGVAAGDPAKVKANVEALNSKNDYVAATGNQIDGTMVNGQGQNVTLIHYDSATQTIQAATGVTGSSVGNANGARVALEQTNWVTGASSNTSINTPSFLMPLLNFFGFGSGTTPSSTNVNVSAVAIIESQPSLPIAVNGCCGPDANGNLPAGCTSNWVGTNAAIPWNQAPSGGSNPNNSGWTTYFDNSVSAPDVQDLIRKIAACQGTAGAKVGDNICTNNGQQNPDLRVFEILIGTNPDGTPKCYLTPIIPPTSNFTGCNNTIKAFAQICPLAVCGPGVQGTKNQNLCDPTISGKYVLANVKSCSITDPNAASVSQCYSLRLVREPQVGM
jgi:Flp pilus assembly protein TadG